MKVEIEVLHPGLFSSIQDLGRFDFLKFGVPLSGAMDMYAAKMANLMLHNSDNCAVMEITQMGPKLKFISKAAIAITGANLSPKINNLEVKNNGVLIMEEGDILNFGKRIDGCRTYLAVSGGFQTEEILGSRSWFEGITVNSRCQKRMRLKYNLNSSFQSKTFSAIKFQNAYIFEEELLIYPGPEFDKIPGRIQKRLLNHHFTVGNLNNRMGIQLKEILENKMEPIVTGPVIPGTVQLTPSGKLIILMRDCQTTGGYPRVLQLSQRAIDILSQKIMGDKIVFRLK